MRDKAKDPRFNDPSARLDALLSDFLSKEIPSVPYRGQTALPTSAPLGDLFAEPDAGQAGQSSIADSPAVENRKIASLDRTDVWESTAPRLSQPSPSMPSAKHLAGQAVPDEVERLERVVDAVLSTPSEKGEKKRLARGVGVFALVVIIGGASYWVGTRQTRRQEAPAAGQEVAPSELEPLSATPDIHQETELVAPANSAGGVSAAQADSNIRPIQAAPTADKSVPALVPSQGAPAAASSSAPQSPQNAQVQVSAPQILAPVSVPSNLPLTAVQDLRSVSTQEPVAPLPLPPSSVIPSAEALKKSGSAGAVASPAVPLVKVPAAYPEMARKLNLAGTVEVSVAVDLSGNVTEAKALSGPQLLKTSAEQAVKQWKFKPAMLNGQTVIGRGKVSIIFTPQKR